MPANNELKRQNFNVTSEQEAEILSLQSTYAAPSAKDAILQAVHLALIVGREVRGGKRLGFIDRHSGDVTEVILPELEAIRPQGWDYLVARPHSWRRQLFVKGRKLTAAQVWREMRVNGLTDADAAENWDLPLAAVQEIVRYCEENRDFLRAEAAEEKLNLLQHGVKLDP